MNSITNYLIRICLAGPCKMNFADDLLKQAKKLAADHSHIQVEQRGCMSRCITAPNLEIVDIENNQTISVYDSVMPNDLDEIIQSLVDS